VLKLLTKPRLVELARELGVGLSLSATKEVQVVKLGGSDLPTLARLLTRDELKLVCRAHGLDDTGRARTALAARLLGTDAAALPPPLFAAPAPARDLPEPGDILQVRHRQYLVEDVFFPQSPDEQTRVRGVCLDDDNQGRPLEFFWELELGARVLSPETHGLGEVRALDPPQRFAAYLHALRWSSVTATDARLFQAPFRAGIALMNHQLTPLKKALELPRANLFIADDVGLGKTIEAGLVLQELLLRQQVDLCLVVAPASVCLQWRDEMQRRFGLRFEIYGRAFVAQRRKERGFGVNPWSTHNRFIISYQTLRRPEYRDPLLQRLGDRARKSLLILDEAHTAAPQSASKYAVDSRITRVIRELAPRFDNRLFLSATPHNGHSNSFSALCELLDPQRFTRGVPPSRTALDTVMVRRLKSDLRALGVDTFPLRKVVQLDVGTADAAEVALSRLLAEYTRLMKPARGRGRLVFVNLQKRLLSSVDAFRRTLEVHARAVAEGRARTALTLPDVDDDEYGPDDDAVEDALAADADASSRLLPSPAGQAQKLLGDMQELARTAAARPDAKVEKLIDWIRANQCPAVHIGGAKRGAELRWSDRRLLVFTEYGDTKRYLVSLLRTAASGTHLGDERLLELHGGMSDEQRDEIQRAFNDPGHPVRILVATDAAREGVNLQGCCQDLVHFDVPWNPARMEQRNGRIDRTLQPEREVRCAYFFYPDRREDIVLTKLVQKVETIQAELGSLGGVVLDRLADVLDQGIDDATEASLEAAGEAPDLRATVKEELETQRELARLRRDIDDNAAIAKASRKVLDFEPALLRGVLDVGLALAGAGPLQPAGDETFVLPPLGDAWQATLDTLRRPRGRDESFWEWRDAAPPQPVVFRPPPKVNSPVVQLHLSHPFVQRILSRFLAQGFSAHDLARVTALRNPHDDEVIALAFGRLSLFGPGATRLHDELVAVAARRPEAGPRPEPLPDADQKKALADLERLLGEPDAKPVGPAVASRLAASAPADFAALWEAIKDEADGRAHEAERKLTARAEAEAAALRRILEEQQKAIDRELRRRQQLVLDFGETEADQREQFERDRQHMSERLARSRAELDTEPEQIRSLYKVSLRRLEPVGLVYLWPETRG
jgi:superfamily II DNA or RNA helicase